MSAHSLATRYAKSLIGLAQEKGSLDEAFNDVRNIDGILSANRDLQLAFKSPLIPTDKKLTIVKLLFENKTSDIIYKFLVLVIKKGREAHLREIFTQFIIQYNTINGITPVKLTTAVKLDEVLVKSLIASLKRNENLKEVQLHEAIDESMIGGFVLEYGGKMIDGSVSRNLSDLKNLVLDDTYIKRYS